MKVEAIKPINGVCVLIDGDEIIYVRQDNLIPLWYEPDLETLSLKLLSRRTNKYVELEAAYQSFIKTS